jgi:cation:H+ antiporter
LSASVLFDAGLLVVAGMLLWKGADWLVEAAASIALAFGVSELVVGLTIVAMGTSAPELAVSVTAAWSGQGDVSLGNVVGSNIFNTGIVLAIGGLVARLPAQQLLIVRDGGLLVVATALLWYFVRDGELARGEGCAMIALMAGYLLGLGRSGRRPPGADENLARAPIDWWTFSRLLLGLTLVVLGGRLLVDAAVGLATAAGMSQWLIATTIVAAGTSAPELVTTLSAVRSGHREMAIGGLIGSDIFNVLLVLGVAAAIRPMQELAGHSSSLLVMLATVVGTLVVLRLGRGVGRPGALLLLGVALGRWILEAL